MSDVVKPETIIAEAINEHRYDGNGSCVACPWVPPNLRAHWQTQIVMHQAVVAVERLAAHGHTIVQKPDHTKPSPALIQAAYIAQDDLSKPPPQWAINAAAEIVDEYIRAQGNETVRVLGHPAAAVSATQEER